MRWTYCKEGTCPRYKNYTPCAVVRLIPKVVCFDALVTEMKRPGSRTRTEQTEGVEDKTTKGCQWMDDGIGEASCLCLERKNQANPRSRLLSGRSNPWGEFGLRYH
jgi:hypothetical protein